MKYFPLIDVITGSTRTSKYVYFVNFICYTHVRSAHILHFTFYTTMIIDTYAKTVCIVKQLSMRFHLHGGSGANAKAARGCTQVLTEIM